MRILHLSDFHLSHDALEKEKAKMIVDKIIEAVLPYNKKKQIDFIFFSGDAVNQGGVSFNSLDAALGCFKDIFISPLLDALKLSSSHFLLCIGNHDVDRKADSEMTEVGISSTCKDEDAVNAVLSKPNWIESNVKRILPFYNFERAFYGEDSNFQLITPLQSLFKYECDGKILEFVV